MAKSMKGRRYARKRDDNEPEIIEALHEIGAHVWPLDKPTDLLAVIDGEIWMIEVKNGNQPKSWQRITKDQAEFFEFADKAKAKNVAIVNSKEQVFELFS